MIVYFETFANMLEERLKIQLPVVSFRNNDMDWINKLTLQPETKEAKWCEPVAV